MLIRNVVTRRFCARWIVEGTRVEELAFAIVFSRLVWTPATKSTVFISGRSSSLCRVSSQVEAVPQGADFTRTKPACFCG